MIFKLKSRKHGIATFSAAAGVIPYDRRCAVTLVAIDNTEYNRLIRKGGYFGAQGTPILTCNGTQADLEHVARAWWKRHVKCLSQRS